MSIRGWLPCILFSFAACLFVCSCDDGGAECGNNRIEGTEQCDGTEVGGQSCSGLGHVGGQLGCTDSCTYDESGCSDCGNDGIDEGESCDGEELGEQTCVDLGYDGGELACTDACLFDESGCYDCGGTDPCAGQACSGHGTCRVTDCTASCECDAGYLPLNGLVCSETTCAPPDPVPDPWVITFRPYNFSTRSQVPEALVEVYRSDGTLLESGTSSGLGWVQLSIPTGGKPIDGYWVVSKSGYLPTRFRIQGGMGNFTNWSSMMVPESWADDFVQTHWGETRNPDAAVVFVGLFECNQGSEYQGVPGATLSFYPAGAAPVYMTPSGIFEPALTDTTAFGDAIAANVPAGDNTITVHLGGKDTAYERPLLAGTWEVIILYPRATDEIPACAPGDVTDFTPEWKTSGGLSQGICTDQQLADFFGACFGSQADAAACTAWKEDALNADCFACAQARLDAPIWNAVIEDFELGLYDTAQHQCISAFEGDSSEDSCGAKRHVARRCTIHACRNNCPIRPPTAQADLADFLQCQSDADSTVCSGYTDESDACSEGLLGLGDPIDQCLWDSGAEEWAVYAMRLATLTCGDGTVGP